MVMFHATLAVNLAGILREGILCSKSRGRLKAVWLHSKANKSWAVTHTVRRHGGQIQDVVILEVNVPRSWLKRHSMPGKCYTLRDVPPSHVGRAEFFALFSK